MVFEKKILGNTSTSQNQLKSKKENFWFFVELSKIKFLVIGHSRILEWFGMLGLIGSKILWGITLGITYVILNCFT